MSRAHCRIDVPGDEVSVTDLNSTNGTFLDNKRLSGSAPFPHGALLRIGNYVLTCEYQSELRLEAADSTQRKGSWSGDVAVLQPRRGRAILRNKPENSEVNRPPISREKLRR